MTPFAILAAKLVAQGLPLLAQAVTRNGPKATAEIATRIGAVEATPEVVAQAIEAQDPDDLLALRTLEYEEDEKQRQHVERLADKEEVAYATQEANIREARASTPDLNPTRRLMTYVMLLALILSLGGLIAVEIWWDVPDMVLGLAVGVIGGFATLLQQMVAYFFGTSSGSAAKERTAAAERMVVAERGSR